MIAANFVRFVGCNHAGPARSGWPGAYCTGSADGHGGAIRAARHCALPHPAARDDCISSLTAARVLTITDRSGTPKEDWARRIAL